MLRWIGVLFLVCCSFSVTAKELVLGRAPQLSPEETLRDWKPFVNYLNEQTGLKIRLKIYSDRTNFEQDLIDGTLDLFYGNPGYGVVAHKMHGYIPLIRSNRKKLTGIVVVRKDSPFNNVQQLNGQEIAFPSETAFAASLYIRQHLTESVGIKFRERYFGSHDNVYRNVLVGTVMAGGGVTRTLEREPAALRDQLRILYETPGTSPHPLSVHPRVTKKDQEKITDAVLALNANEKGKVMLKKLKIQKPVKADYENDYKNIERVSLKMYEYMLER